MLNDLENKTILVTGGSRGIGADIVRKLAKMKAHVLINFRSENDSLQSLVTECESYGAKVTKLQFDITNLDETKEVLNAFIKDVGPIEGLVNNAGISKDTLALRVKAEEIDHIFSVNLKSTMLLTNFLTRNFLRANNPSVVNISSVVGLMGNASQTVYSASKAGLIGYTKSYAKELAPKKIRANAICPGFIQTDMTDALSDEVSATYKSSIPLSEFGSGEDVANLCCFLLSSASSYITGEIIKVDGGLYI